MSHRVSRRGWRLLAAVAAVGLALSGCDRQRLYHHFEPTPAAGWDKSDTLLFTVPAAGQRAVVQRAIDVRTTHAYPFRRLSLVVEQVTVPSRQDGAAAGRTVVRRDTVDGLLDPPRSGVTTDGVGLHQYRFTLPDVSLNEGDSLSLRIRHDMQRELLPGIADVGVCLTAY